MHACMHTRFCRKDTIEDVRDVKFALISPRKSVRCLEEGTETVKRAATKSSQESFFLLGNACILKG